MTVFPPDQRRVIKPNSTEFTTFPFPAVIAIDSQIVIPLVGGGIRIKDYFEGSGIAISPNYVLTAGHDLFRIKLRRELLLVRINLN